MITENLDLRIKWVWRGWEGKISLSNSQAVFILFAFLYLLKFSIAPNTLIGEENEENVLAFASYPVEVFNKAANVV